MMGIKKIITGLLLCACASTVFAKGFELYAAAPMVLEEKDKSISSVGAGLGVGFTGLDAGDVFGVTVNGVVFYRAITESFFLETGPKSMEPLGVDFNLGCSVLPFDTRRLTLPVTIAFHANISLLEEGTQLDIGISGKLGFNFFASSKLALFARSQFYMDFSRIRFMAAGKKIERQNQLNMFGIVPELGISIPLNKGGYKL
jgi:hypothetical protein